MSLQRHLISLVRIHLSVSAVRILDLQAYRNIEMAKESINLIFELCAMFRTVFRDFLQFYQHCCCLDDPGRYSISGFDPLSATMAPGFMVSVVLVASFWQLILIPLVGVGSLD